MFKTQEFRQIALLAAVLWTVDVLLFFAPNVLLGESISAAATARIVLIGLEGMALSALIFAVVRGVAGWSGPARYASVIAVSILCGGVVSGLDLLAKDPLRELLSPAETPLSPDTVLIHALVNWIGLAWIFWLTGVIFLLLRSNRMVQQRDRDLAAAQAAALKAENAATAARLAALRYQLNPHFLFNTLNAVSSAVVNLRIEEAETMLSRLAEFLRVTLAADPEAMVLLEEELEALHAYLAIEGERFRERLGVRFVCPSDLERAEIPNFLLQPLVENSIKHAVSRTTRPVTLLVEARREGEQLVIVVEDDGEAAPAEQRSGGGVGVANVRQRLEALYGDRSSLESGAKPGGGYRTLIRMPLRLREEQALAA